MSEKILMAYSEKQQAITIYVAPTLLVTYSLSTGNVVKASMPYIGLHSLRYVD